MADVSDSELEPFDAPVGERLLPPVETGMSGNGAAQPAGDPGGTHSPHAPTEKVDGLPDEAVLSTREQRLASLVAGGDLLGSSLSYQKTLLDLADLMVPRFADWCAVDIANERGVLERLAVAHVNPEKRRVARDLHERYPRLQGRQGSTAVFRSGEAQWARWIPDDWLIEAATDAEQLAVLRDLGLRSYVSVPLAARGTVLGVLTLVMAESGRVYEQEDLTFAQAVASRAAVAIDNSRLFEAAQSELRGRRRAEQHAAAWEDDARQRLDELQALMDLVPVGIAVARDSIREDISVNAEAAAMLGIDRTRNASKSAAGAQTLPFRVLREGREVPPGELPLQWALANDAPVRGEELEVVRDDGSALTLLESAVPLRDATGAVRGCIGVFTDISRRRESERLLEGRARRLEAIAAIVQPGLSGEPLQALLDTAVQRIAWALDVELCDVLEFQPDRHSLLFRAGIGWEPGLIGEAATSAAPDTLSGYALLANEPWATLEWPSAEGRLRAGAMRERHGVVAGASVRIGAEGGPPYGVLGVYSRQPRRFSDEECRFLQAAADMLANLLRGRRAVTVAEDSRDQLDFTLDAANLGTWEWNIVTGEVTWTEGLMRIHGRAPGEFHGTADSAFSDAHPEDRERVRRAVAATLDTDAPYRVEYRILTAGGQVRWVEARGRVVRDEDGRPVRFHGICMDVTERKQLEQELQHAASHDPLTGLPNRALFLDRLQHLLERGARGNVDYAVLLLDLDDFKQINDSLGHLAGDSLLVQFSERVKRCLRPGDTFARLGGDEFVLLLEEEGGEAGMNAVAQRILAQTAHSFRIDAHNVHVGVSIGAMVGIDGCQRPQDVLRRADIALYEAKKEGKGCLRCPSLKRE